MHRHIHTHAHTHTHAYTHTHKHTQEHKSETKLVRLWRASKALRPDSQCSIRRASKALRDLIVSVLYKEGFQGLET